MSLGMKWILFLGIFGLSQSLLADSYDDEWGPAEDIDPFEEEKKSSGGSGGEEAFFLFEQNILVKSATKTLQTIAEAPSIISVISADEIKRNNYSSVAEALSKVSGLFVSYDYVFYDVAVRGVSGELRGRSRVIKVMINGVPISFRIETTNFLGPELIPMSAIEKIEVIRGPGSALYGANAFLGVVNIITKKGKELKGGGLVIGSNLFNSKNLGYSYDAYFGEHFEITEDFKMDLFLSFSKRRDDRSGLKLDSDQENLEGGEKGIFARESFDDISQPTTFFGSLDFDFEKLGVVSFFLNHQSIDSRGSFSDWGTLNYREENGKSLEKSGNRVGLENNIISAKYVLGLFDDKLELAFGLNYAKGGVADHDALTNAQGKSLKRDHYGFKGSDYFSEFRLTALENTGKIEGLTLINNLTLIGGGDFSEDKVKYMKDAIKEETNEATLTNFGYFAQLTASLFNKRVGLAVGGRKDKHTGAEIGEDFSTKNVINPRSSDTVKKKKFEEFSNELCDGKVCYESTNFRVGTTFLILKENDFEPFQELYAKVLWGTAFKAPSPLFLYNDGYFSSNPLNFEFRLKPQEVDSLEFLLAGRLLDKKLFFSFTYFINKLSQKAVFYKDIKGFMAAKNDADVESKGIETEFSFRMNPVEIYFNASLQSSERIFKDSDDSDTTKRISDAIAYPDKILAGGVLYFIKDLKLVANISFQYVGERIGSYLNNKNTEDNESLSYTLDPYFLLNLNLSTHKLEIWEGHETLINFGLKNLLGQKYFYPGFQPYYKYDTPGLPRILTLTVDQKY